MVQEKEIKSEKERDTSSQKLVEKILETEEKIFHMDKELQQNKKEIKQIKKSNTWTYSKPFRKTFDMYNKLLRRKQLVKQEERIADLEEELAKTKKSLFKANQQFTDQTMENLPLHEDQITRFLRELRDSGELISFLNRTVQRKKNLQENYANVLKYIARLYMNDHPEYREWVFHKILAVLHNEEIPEFMMRPGLTNEQMPLKHISSYRSSMNTRMRQNQLQETPLPEWVLDDKQKAYQFVEQLGIRIPWVSKQTYRLGALPFKESVVIKPADGAGSRGVYLVNDKNNIVDLKRKEQLESWDQLLERMRKDLVTKWVEQDEWIIEELLLEEPDTHARDVKFYCFYGQVGVILEITRYPEPKYCWWTPSGERVRVGKYDEDIFEGLGATSEEISMVEDLSKEIPAPFIRIDFLRTQDGLVFGEFTPKPGNYDEFDEETDERLGDYFLQAENHLINDLMAGKEFQAFNRLNKHLIKE